MIPLAIRHHVLAAAMAALATIVGGPLAHGATIGLPVTRNYTLDEIGELSRGVHLGFDRIGRIAVIGSDAYVVLNDTTWLDIAEKGNDTPSMMQVVTDPSGTSYFGGLAAWGETEYTLDGRLRSRNVRPTPCPEWVTSTNFVHIVPQGTGAFFAGANGVVYWNRATGEHVFFGVRGGTTIFALGRQVFASSYSKGIQRLDLERRSVETVSDGALTEIVVEHAIELGGDVTLMATVTGRLLVFDGNTVMPWGGPLSGDPSGRVTGLKRLTDGGIALAVDGRGLFILSDQGEIRLSLTSPEYHRIHDLAVREAGVLWVATEGAVQKLLYGSPVTIVDRRVGVPIGWPQIVQWNGQTLIASSGRLYESVPSDDGQSIRFALVAEQPLDGAWAIATRESRLLIGNRGGVYGRTGNTFEPVLLGIEVGRLVMVTPELCYVISATEIAVLRWADGRWSECAPRVPGVGFPAVVHSAGTSAWIELGTNRVARVTLGADGLHARVFNQFPWTEPRWVNIGVVDHTVVLSGGLAGALFFDERTGDFGDAPKLRQFLASAPVGFARVRNDSRGNLWISHEKGVLLAPAGTEPGNAAPGRSFVRIVRDFQPLVQIAGPDDVWISTEKTLYHVNRSSFDVARDSVQPYLTSVVDRRTGQELYSAMRPTPRVTRLPYTQNSLSFRFFSGSYATLRAPLYEFTMRSRTSTWSTQSTDSLLTLHDLKEGAYRLSVRLVDPSGRPPAPVEVEFSIAPPWHRSPLAYGSYGTVALLGGCGLVFWAIQRTRRRHAFLESLVRERTEELRSTMAKLNEETRNAATLTERNRLAGEIHDSLQQGLSGLILQLDATLKLPDLNPDVRSKLAVARNMVSFTRHEVQHAVWNLESPLLENADLTGALKKLAGLISSGLPQVEIKTSGISIDVPSSTKHQLLRIAQEAITNAVRHGHAQKVFVHLEYSAEGMSLEIFDDGRGFEPREVFAKGIGHFGLRGLRGRAAKINADLQIISAPNRGTTVRIVIPLARDPTPAHVPIASV